MTVECDVLAAVDSRAPLVGEVMRFVHAHPEMGHEEHECSRYLCEALARVGLEVETGVRGDGHRLSRRAAGGAARPLGRPGLSIRRGPHPARRRSRRTGALLWSWTDCRRRHSGRRGAGRPRKPLAGGVTVIGCPADEIHAPGTVRRGGGKALAVQAGLWDGIDAALYAHPEFIDTVSLESLWMRRDRVSVFGKRSVSGAEQAPLIAARAALDAERPGEVMLERLVAGR